tara:strand:+ start:447 stop:551 length:105 start_codon:yes stop_codon:yes gene_type:complete
MVVEEVVENLLEVLKNLVETVVEEQELLILAHPQ